MHVGQWMGCENQGKETNRTSEGEALAVWLELTSKQQKTMREQIKVMEKAIYNTYEFFVR